MPVAGTYGMTASFAATLTAAGSPLGGEPVTFTITVGGQATTLGTATTDVSGVASLSGVNLTIVSAGVYPVRHCRLRRRLGHRQQRRICRSPRLPPRSPGPCPRTSRRARRSAPCSSTPPRRCRAPSPTRRPPGRSYPRGTVQTLTAVFTPADTTDYKSASVSTTLNVLNPPPSSNVTLTSIRGAKVRIGTGRKAKKATVVVLQFSGALDPSTAQNVGDYSLLAGTIKKHVVRFSKSVPLASAIYSPSAQTVTLLPQGKRKLPKYEQLTIASGLLTDSLGRPIDGGHTVVVTVGRSGQVISQAAVSTAQAPSAAMVDALFAGEQAYSARDTVKRLGARRSGGW